MMSRWYFLFAPIVLLLPVLRAADDGPVTVAETGRVKKVYDKLLGEMPPVADVQWPPQLVIDSSDRPWAITRTLINPKEKARTEIVVSAGLLRTVVQDNDDALAFVIAHELGHILHRHQGLPRPVAPLAAIAHQQQCEYEADATAVKLMLNAGYSMRNAFKSLTRNRDFTTTHPQFERPQAPSPSWDARFTRLDREKPAWQSMRAYHHGVLFLALGQYETAETCFERVVKEFPGCAEAWANLGIACLMQYCDSLTDDNLAMFDLGQFVCTSLYKRGAIMRGIGGLNDKLWWRAVGSLREAQRLKPDMAVVKANLGLAYLVNPAGKQAAQAAEYLEEAIALAEKDRSVDPAARAALLVNLGVAHLANGRTREAMPLFEKALTLNKGASVSAAIVYNAAFSLAASDSEKMRRQAVELFEQYLQTNDPRSTWWPLAYAKYAEVCRQLGRDAKAQADLKKAAAERLRVQITVALASGERITLGEPTEDLFKHLGEQRGRPILPRTNLSRYDFERHGVEVIATDDVRAIVLCGAKAPPVQIRGKNDGGKATELRLGMTRREIEKLLGGEAGSTCDLHVPELVYHFYRHLGLGLRYDGTGPEAKVIELVVVQTPDMKLLDR